MPPCARDGFRGVRARPNGTYYAEIRAAELHFSLGTYETAHEAARAYDAAAWQLGRPRWSMNFDDARSAEQAAALAPPHNLVTSEEKRRQKQISRRLAVVVADERAMAQWRLNFPEDVRAERKFYADRRAVRVAERAEKRAKKAFIEAQRAGPRTISSDDERWGDMFLTSEETTPSDEDGFDFED
ncbi:unnamed protein product [Alopecurus aequalis]